MTENEAIKRIEEFGLYHAIGDLPNYTLTVKAFEMAIEALQEIQQYREIGTVDECRMAMERLIPKKSIIGKVFKTMGYYQCPICRGLLMRDEKFCNDCGQRIEWQ